MTPAYVWFNPESILRQFSITLDDRSFINAQILDELSGTLTTAKTRKLTPIVSAIIEGTDLTCDDVLRTMKVQQDGKVKSIVTVAVS